MFLEEEGTAGEGQEGMEGQEGEGSPDTTDTPSGQGNDPLEGEGEPKEGEAQGGRDPKNIAAENRRKSDEIKELRAQMAALKEQIGTVNPKPEEKAIDPLESINQRPDVRKSIDRIKERLGLEDDDIRALLDVMGHTSDVVARRHTGQFSSRFAEQDLAETINTLKADDNWKFIIEKYGSEVKDTLKENKVSPELWGNEKIVTAMLGIVATRHLKDIARQPEKKIDRGIMQEGKPGTGGTLPSGISSQELAKYGAEIGYTAEDMKDSTVRKSVLDALNAKKKALNGK